MKFLALLATTAVAFISAADVPACDLGKLVEVSTGSAGIACSAATGDGASAVAIPTGNTLVTVCTNKDCKEYIKQLTAAVPTECTYEGVLLKSTVIDKFPAACASVSSSNSSTNSTTNTTTTTAPTTTPTKVPAVNAPAAPTDKTSNSSASTTAPTTTPAPTSGASTVAAAAVGAVAAALVASLV